MDRYVERVAEDMAAVKRVASAKGAELPSAVDSIYVGGGTPSILLPAQMERLFRAVRGHFEVSADAEVTVECAPGQIADEMLGLLPRLGVNRVSLGLQSFVDQEARAVGRLHTREVTLADIDRLRRAGIRDLNLDLIAGLPHQTAASWQESLDAVVATGVPHVSVYMLEVDDDSRLGRELIAGGTRYHAHHVPDEDLVADLYIAASERLNAAGIRQYEISNFAVAGKESRHNLKYWTRQPYVGFGLDAHSMLRRSEGRNEETNEAIRWAAIDDLDRFLEDPGYAFETVDAQRALEEEFFLGLRLNRGVDLESLQNRAKISESQLQAVATLVAEGMLQPVGTSVQLTQRGRLLSNEVFTRFLLTESASVKA